MVRLQEPLLSIVSQVELSVSAVYTANPLSGDGISIDVQCMSSEHFGQLAWQFKRMSGSSGLKVQAAIAC